MSEVLKGIELEEEQWDEVILPKRNLLDLNLSEIWKYRFFGMGMFDWYGLTYSTGVMLAILFLGAII